MWQAKKAGGAGAVECEGVQDRDEPPPSLLPFRIEKIKEKEKKKREKKKTNLLKNHTKFTNKKKMMQFKKTLKFMNIFMQNGLSYFYSKLQWALFGSHFHGPSVVF